MHEISQLVRVAWLLCIHLAVAGVLDGFPFSRFGRTRPHIPSDSGCADPGGSCPQPDDHVGAKTVNVTNNLLTSLWQRRGYEHHLPVPVSVQGTGSVTGSVTVTNLASNPVPTQNVGGGAATQVGQPRSKIANLTCNNNGTGSCTTANGTLAVPSGQALVITDVQWRVFSDTIAQGNTDFVFVSSNGVSLPTLFAAPISSTCVFGGQAHLTSGVVVAPRSSVSTFSTGNGVVFLQGYLVPNQ